MCAYQTLTAPQTQGGQRRCRCHLRCGVTTNIASGSTSWTVSVCFKHTQRLSCIKVAHASSTHILKVCLCTLSTPQDSAACQMLPDRTCHNDNTIWLTNIRRWVSVGALQAQGQLALGVGGVVVTRGCSCQLRH